MGASFADTRQGKILRMNVSMEPICPSGIFLVQPN